MKVYLKNEICGTEFIELQKGKYDNLHFLEDSIYFYEEDFVVFELIFLKFNSRYSPFKYINFNKSLITMILKELSIFLNKLYETHDIINALKDMKYNKELKESSAQDEKAKKEYEEIKKEVMAELKKELRPEFINRIDEIIVFHKLNDNDINQIIDIMLKEVVNRLKEQKYEIEFEPDVKEMIAKEGIDKNFGARPLRRTIQNLVEDKLAEEILDGKLKKGKVNKITVRQLGQS